MECFKCAVFIPLGVAAVYHTHELPNAGPGDVPKCTLPSLGRGVHTFFYIVSGWQCVKTAKDWLKSAIFIALGAAVYCPQ